jgi:hypothetical protein
VALPVVGTALTMVGELKEGRKKQKRLLEHRRKRIFIVVPSADNSVQVTVRSAGE